MKVRLWSDDPRARFKWVSGTELLQVFNTIEMFTMEYFLVGPTTVHAPQLGERRTGRSPRWVSPFLVEIQGRLESRSFLGKGWVKGSASWSKWRGNM